MVFYREGELWRVTCGTAISIARLLCAFSAPAPRLPWENASTALRVGRRLFEALR
jgi:hypothetical protein